MVLSDSLLDPYSDFIPFGGSNKQPHPSLGRSWGWGDRGFIGVK